MVRGFWRRGGDGGSEGCKCGRVSNRGSKCESCPHGEILHSFHGLVMKKRWETLAVETGGRSGSPSLTGQPLTPCDDGVHHLPLSACFPLLLQPLLSDGTLPICKLVTACAFVRISPSISTLCTQMWRQTNKILNVTLQRWIITTT